MKIFLKFFFLILVCLVIFNQEVILLASNYGFSKWTERKSKAQSLKIDYEERSLIFEKITVKDPEEFYDNTFFAKKIILKPNLKTLFEDTIIIEKLIILSPTFFYRLENKGSNLKDNTGYVEKKIKDTPKKIWPSKKKDKNFIIKELQILDAKAEVSTPFFKKTQKVNLSNMFFANVGNETGYQHYKDVIKSILLNIVGRIPNKKFRKFIRSYLK